jgi:hypothetical protein
MKTTDTPLPQISAPTIARKDLPARPHALTAAAVNHPRRIKRCFDVADQRYRVHFAIHHELWFIGDLDRKPSGTPSLSTGNTPSPIPSPERSSFSG